MPSYHFISGLPRSGSTLLAAILRQNPRFHACMIGPMGGLVSANLQMMSAGSELSLLIPEEQRPGLLRGLFDAYYAKTPNEVIFDTHRQWSAKLPLLAQLFPGAKVIACVRDVSWIMDSLERILQKNPFENSRLFSTDAERASVYSRVETLGRHDRLVGGAWAALKEAFYGPHADSLLVVEYELLAGAPEKVLPLIYQFIGEPWFEGHDFANVQFAAPAFDAALGVAGLHSVRPRVAFEPRRSVLPPDLFAKYQGMDFWRDVAGSQAHVVVAKNQEECADGA